MQAVFRLDKNVPCLTTQHEKINMNIKKPITKI